MDLRFPAVAVPWIGSPDPDPVFPGWDPGELKPGTLPGFAPVLVKPFHIGLKNEILCRIQRESEFHGDAVLPERDPDGPVRTG